MSDLFLVIPDNLDRKLMKYKKAEGYDKRQPIILEALREYLKKRGYLNG